MITYNEIMQAIETAQMIYILTHITNEHKIITVISYQTIKTLINNSCTDDTKDEKIFNATLLNSVLYIG